MPTPHEPSIGVRRALRVLGQNIKAARPRRNLSAEVVADRAFTSRPTLNRIEKGDAGVGIGIYAPVLHALGQLEASQNIASIQQTSPVSIWSLKTCPCACAPGRLNND